MTKDEMLESIKASAGYAKLLEAVNKDKERTSQSHDYDGKLQWILDMVMAYSEKTGIDAGELLTSFENDRTYWYMNYYQEANQPTLDGDVHVFETPEAVGESFNGLGFRCPACNGVSTNPQVCDTGIKVDGKVCDWKSYGLFRTLGKGAKLFVKFTVANGEIFMPIAWEQQ